MAEGSTYTFDYTVTDGYNEASEAVAITVNTRPAIRRQTQLWWCPINWWRTMQVRYRLPLNRTTAKTTTGTGYVWITKIGGATISPTATGTDYTVSDTNNKELGTVQLRDRRPDDQLQPQQQYTTGRTSTTFWTTDTTRSPKP